MEEQNLGNLTVKVKTGASSEMLVYKCPHINCTAFYPDYKDLQSHRVLSHGDVPKFFNQSNSVTGKRFTKETLGKQNIYRLRYEAGKMAALLGIMFKQTKSQREAKQKKEAIKV